jgi:esterase
MANIQLPNIRLYYEEHGAGAPILCIHGTSSSALMWGGSIEPLARLGRVIIYDRRGCTRSERPNPYLTTSPSEHADDAAALLGALAATPAIVIGRSYGGEVALDLALRYPRHVRALILLEGATLTLSPEARQWDAAMTERILASAADRPELAAELLLREVLGDAVWEEFPAELQCMFADNSPAVLAEFRGGPLGVTRDQLTRIRQPALLVAAADSPAAFREATRAVAAAIPGARVELIDGGHLVNPAHPVVLGFIEQMLADQVARAVIR